MFFYFLFKIKKLFLPEFLTWYIALSALLIISSIVSVLSVHMNAPIESPIEALYPAKSKGSLKELIIFVHTLETTSWSDSSLRITTNSSPPILPNISSNLILSFILWEPCINASSPISCPNWSFTFLNPSKSMIVV